MLNSVSINKTINWGIIGSGNIAEEFADDFKHVTNYNNVVKSVLANELKHAKSFAEKYNTSYYFDKNKLTDFFKIPVDCIYIATPHTAHAYYTTEALKRKIPVLCEKPLAINTKEVNDMIALAKANNTFLMEGMWIRFLPSITHVLEVISKGAIGKVISINANLSFKAPKDENNRFFNPDLGGGSLLDLGVYPVYLSYLLLGKPDRIQAFARLTNEKIDECCSAILSYNDSQYAIIESSIITSTDITAKIYGEEGTISILKPWNEKPEAVIVEDNKYPHKKKFEWKGHGFQYEIEEVCNCITNKKTFSEKLSLRNSLDLMSIMDEIRGQTNIEYKVPGEEFVNNAT